MVTPSSPAAMNSLLESLKQLSEDHDLLSTFLQNTPSAMSSSQQREKVMPLKARLLSRTGTPAPTVPELSCKAEYVECTVKNQTSLTPDGEKLSELPEQSCTNAELKLSSIDPVENPPSRQWNATFLTKLMAGVRDRQGKPHPAHWYDEPEDRMLVFMGNDPRPGGKYTIRKND